MPRGGRRANGRLMTDHKQADVTLDDFANSKVSATRLRKPASNSLVREVKQLSITEDDEFTKALDDVDETNELSKQPDASACKGKAAKSKIVLFNSGVAYPLDLWFILADYIRPEDVQVFATICKSSAFVVNTFQFWMGIYKRHYSSNPHLPERLHPEHIRRSTYLRACVIRSLFHVYPPFATRTARAALDEEVYNLIPLKCISVWHTNANNKWCFFFKFRSNCSLPQQKATNPLIHMACDTWSDNSDYEVLLVRDVNANPEDGCRVLSVSCLHYTAVMPSIMGARLADVKINMKEAHHHVVRLFFASNSYQCSPRHRNSTTKGSVDVVQLDSVESSQVYHWWHPKYPFCHNF